MATRSPSASRKRIRRKPADAEREILAAAEAFLQTNDFRDLAVDEVMSRTGMVRSAFYNYFADRNALVLRLLQDVEAEMMEVGQPWLAQTGDDPIESLRTGLDGIVEIYARHGHVLRAIHEASYHDHDVERSYHGFLNNFIEVVAARLRKENRAGRVDVPRPGDVAHALLMMNANVLVERLGRPPADRPRDVAKTLRYIWEQAIYATPPGVEGRRRHYPSGAPGSAGVGRGADGSGGRAARGRAR